MILRHMYFRVEIRDFWARNWARRSRRDLSLRNQISWRITVALSRNATTTRSTPTTTAVALCQPPTWRPFGAASREPTLPWAQTVAPAVRRAECRERPGLRARAPLKRWRYVSSPIWKKLTDGNIPIMVFRGLTQSWIPLLAASFCLHFLFGTWEDTLLRIRVLLLLCDRDSVVFCCPSVFRLFHSVVYKVS